jgi:uncharacterized protein (TIGR02246 family)
MSSRVHPSLRAVLGAAFLSTATLPSPPSASAQAAPKWVQEHETAWVAAYNAGDTPALSKLWADDGVLLLGDQILRGRQAIESFARTDFEQTRHSCSFPIHGAQVLDKLAAVWGHSSCTNTPKSGGAARTSQGQWLRVYQLQADGSWLIVRDSGQPIRP